jgi:hypothetical protein
MKHTKEHPLQEQFETARACLERMCPPDQRNRRASIATSTVRALADYRTYLSALEQSGDGAAGCRGLRGQLVDRAFEAESHVRVLLAEGVSALNELRDSGMLYSSLRMFAEEIGDGQIDLAKSAREAVHQVQKSLDLPAAFTDEVLRMMEQHAIRVRYDKKSECLVVRTKDVADAAGEARIRIAPRAGDIGRIDLEKFFGPSGSVSMRPAPGVMGSDDCHQPKGHPRPPQSIDAYSAMLGSFAAAREAIYGHARKASRYGHGTALRAKDPVVAVLVVIGVAATVFLIAALGAVFTGGGPTFTLFGTSLSIAATIAVVAGVAGIAAIVILALMIFEVILL